MRLISFIELMISAILLVLSVGFLHLLKIDINFITTLLLTIFAIAISIFFYSESNRVYQKLKDLIGGLDVKMAKIEEHTKDIIINRYYDSLSQEQIKRRFTNERKIRF